jgi:Holliday junction resolvasome RuvABC endonuclease subunit
MLPNVKPFSHLVRFVESIHETHGLELLAAEDAQLGSHNFRVQGQHAEMRGALRLTAERLGVPLVLVNPASLKKYATGNGKAKKPDMIRAAKLEGKHFDSDDECDAWWVLRYVQAGCHERTPSAVKRKVRAARKKEARLFK